jgi:hypothetical protein
MRVTDKIVLYALLKSKAIDCSESLKKKRKKQTNKQTNKQNPKKNVKNPF